MTPTELLAIARVVYPRYVAEIIANKVYVFRGEPVDMAEVFEFSPKIGGNSHEESRALRVIVAALNLDSTAELSKRGGGSWQFINQDPDYDCVKIGGAFADDLLTAAMAAILEHVGREGV